MYNKEDTYLICV